MIQIYSITARAPKAIIRINGEEKEKKKETLMEEMLL